MADLEKLADELSGLTLLEAAELKDLLEDKWGVTAAAPMAVAAVGGGAAAAAEPAEEKTEYDVVLASIVGNKKIAVIKAVRGLTELGLKEAKDLVEGAPSTLIEGIPKEAAEDAKTKLEAEGAVIELK